MVYKKTYEPRGVTILSVTLATVRERAGLWKNEFHTDMTFLFDPDHYLATAFGLGQIPYHVGIDRSGHVIGAIDGADEVALHKLLETLTQPEIK